MAVSLWYPRSAATPLFDSFYSFLDVSEVVSLLYIDISKDTAEILPKTDRRLSFRRSSLAWILQRYYQRYGLTYIVIYDNTGRQISLYERFISVYRLVVDAKHVSVMMWLAENIWEHLAECSQGFSANHIINGSKRHLHQPQGVYFGFCKCYRGQTPPVKFH